MKFGILLSIGVNRYKIIGQFIIELIYISIPSIFFAYVIGNGIVDRVLKEIISKEGVLTAKENSISGLFNMENIATIAQSYGILVIIIAASVLFTLGVLLMKKPKKILSKMS